MDEGAEDERREEAAGDDDDAGRGHRAAPTLVRQLADVHLQLEVGKWTKWRMTYGGGRGTNRIDCSRDAHPDANEEPAGYGAQDGAGGGRDDSPPDEAGHG